MIDFLGPPLEYGTLPAVFYFALSANDSLHLDPYNQPAVFLASSKLRVFSITLPGHAILPRTEALQFWADEIAKGNDVIGSFIQQVTHIIQQFIDQNVIDPTRLGVMGLSRGAFIAAHVAAVFPIAHILGFAPLTRLDYAKEFQGLAVEPWNLIHLTEKLYNKKIRFYIGNRDVRVGTEHSFALISSLAETAFTHQIRSAPLELIISPSIGQHGHGTSKEIFEQGAAWLSRELHG